MTTSTTLTTAQTATVKAFILADAKSKTYFMYAGEDPTDDAARPGTYHNAGVVAYISKDLVSWEGPKMVFEIPEGFWGDVDSSPWAPEVHAFDGCYYLFTTFNAWKQITEIREDRPSITKRASQILVGDAPEGPFKPFGNHPTTPPRRNDAGCHVLGRRRSTLYCLLPRVDPDDGGIDQSPPVEDGFIRNGRSSYESAKRQRVCLDSRQH